MPLAPIQSGDKASGLPGDQLGGKPALKLRYKGPFDYTYLFRELKKWFEQRRFRFYEARIKDSGKRLKVDWWAKRNVDEMFTEQYDIKLEAWDLTTEEVIVNGQPRKILNGQVQFTIKDTLVVDRPGWFKGDGWFQKLMARIYYDIRWREIENNYFDVFQYRAQDLLTFLKKCLNMTTKHQAPW